MEQVVGFAYDMTWRLKLEEKAQPLNSEPIKSEVKKEMGMATNDKVQEITIDVEEESAALDAPASKPASNWADIEIPEDVFDVCPI